MDYIQAALRGDIGRTAELSFDCIQCGLCAMRCPAEIAHYHVGQLARRLHGKYVQPRAPDLARRVKEIENGNFDTELDELARMTVDELRAHYNERDIEEDE
jgi:heterodisulfide reductase subunit C